MCPAESVPREAFLGRSRRVAAATGIALQDESGWARSLGRSLGCHADLAILENTKMQTYLSELSLFMYGSLGGYRSRVPPRRRVGPSAQSSTQP